MDAFLWCNENKKHEHISKEAYIDQYQNTIVNKRKKERTYTKTIYLKITYMDGKKSGL